LAALPELGQAFYEVVNLHMRQIKKIADNSLLTGATTIELTLKERLSAL